MRAAFIVITVLSALAAASCAPADTGTSTPRMTGREPLRQCFSIHQVQNFRQGRSDQVFLRVGRNDVYELNAAGGCTDLDFAISLALIPDMGGSIGSRLCTDEWARIVVPGSTSPNTVCRVRVSQKLTPEEIAALPPRQRP